jgi:hypothetical protein
MEPLPVPVGHTPRNNTRGDYSKSAQRMFSLDASGCSIFLLAPEGHSQQANRHQKKSIYKVETEKETRDSSPVPFFCPGV